MKKIIAGLLLIAASCYAADPVRSLRVDVNKQNAPFALEAWQGESSKWRVYLYQDGQQWVPSSTNYGGLMGFGTNYADSTSMSLATGQMTIATNWIDFAFTGSKLNTNGIFYAQIMVTNTTGGKWVFNEGNWSINKSPITGATLPLALSSILNWDLYSILGTPPYPTNFLSLSDAPHTYSGQGGKTVAVKGDESGLEFSSAGAGDITSVVAGTGLDGGAVSGVATVSLNAASIASLGLADSAVQPGFTLTESEHGSLGGSNRHALADSSKAGFMSALEYLQLQALGTRSNVWDGYGASISGLQSTQAVVVAWQGSVSNYVNNMAAKTNWAGAVVDGTLNLSSNVITRIKSISLGDLGTDKFDNMNTIDLENGYITDATKSIVIDWHNRYLNNSANNTTIDWEQLYLANGMWSMLYDAQSGYDIVNYRTMASNITTALIPVMTNNGTYSGLTLTNLTVAGTNIGATVAAQGVAMVTNNQQNVTLGLISGTTVADATATNEPVSLSQLNEALETFSEKTLFGVTNAHPTIAGAGSLWSTNIADSAWTNVQTHAAASTNLAGTFWNTNCYDTVRAGNYIGRFFAIAAGGGTKYAYMQLVYSADNGATTNVIDTSAQIPIGTSLTSYRIATDNPTDISAPTALTNICLGVRYYTVRTGGGGSGSVTTYGGEPYDAHLETPGLGPVSLGSRGATNVTMSSGFGGVYDPVTRVMDLTNNSNLNMGGYSVTNVGNLDVSGVISQTLAGGVSFLAGDLYFANNAKLSWYDTNAVARTAFFMGNEATNVLHIRNNQLAAGGDISLETPGTTARMRIKNDGNIGIGTTTPATKLDVNGDCTIRSNLNMAGSAITNFSTLSDPSILTGVSNTITLGGAINHYYWDLTNNSQITFAPCISNKGSKAILDWTKSGYTLTLNSTNCITNGLGSISICTNISESGSYSLLIHQAVMGTNIYSRKIGVYQLR